MSTEDDGGQGVRDEDAGEDGGGGQDGGELEEGGGALAHRGAVSCETLASLICKVNALN